MNDGRTTILRSSFLMLATTMHMHR
jgi:hypothetical protein